MFKSSFINQIKPEFVYLVGGVLVPSKKLDYKIDPVTAKKIEIIKPNTHGFENKLREDLNKELAEMKEFPTDQETLVLISYAYRGHTEYNKCDLDNKAKTILDAMKGPVYKDDNQVKILWTFKELLESTEENYFSFLIKILNERLTKKMLSNLKLLYRNV